MSNDIDPDVEKPYELAEFVAELRRLADALEADEPFQIEIDGEQIAVPKSASLSIEHERDDGEEELEFQLRWVVAEEDDQEGGEADLEGDPKEPTTPE